MECSLGYAGNPGRSGHKLAMKMDSEIYEAREKICKLINGTEPLNVIFTFNGYCFRFRESCRSIIYINHNITPNYKYSSNYRLFFVNLPH